MWKFKASPFKNASPKIPKREEWVGDISTSNIGTSCGNHIKSSAEFMVFNTDNAGGSSLGLLPLASKGRLTGQLPSIKAHSDFVTDFDFSPFDDYLLSSSSQDGTVKVWRLPQVGDLVNCITDPLCTLTQTGKRVENVAWNPLADNILGLSCSQTISIFDVQRQSAVTELSTHTDQVQSFSWKMTGNLIVSSCRDKTIRIFDARSQETVQSCSGHQNNKDSRVLWLGERDLILSTGFNAGRQREVVLRDVRNLSTSLKTLAVDASTGILMPLFDVDTAMLFIVGKGDTSVRYLELTDKEPFLVENSVDRIEQTIKGAALVPKRAVDVMSCEVDRMLILAQGYVIALPYCVPRKASREFQSDLFPDTFDGRPLLSSDQWVAGEQSTPVRNLSLDPAKRSSLVHGRSETNRGAGDTPQTGKTDGNQTISADPVPSPKTADTTKTKTSMVEAAASAGVSNKPAVSTESQPSKIFAGVKQCKFRNLEGITVHKSQHIENLRNLCKSIPGESDGFHANTKYCAVPLGGSGGLVAIIKIDAPGRLPDTGLPAVQNGSMVTDFVWDPFNNHRLVVACDDAKIRVWDIPEGGLTETLCEPVSDLRGHQEKIYFVVFHPIASGVLASASYDMTVRIWNVETEEECIQLTGHTDTIFSLAWSADGRQCATVCKDGKIRIYEPRKSSEPIVEGRGLEGTRGGRVVWVCGDQLLAVTGFDRSSGRQVAVYSPKDLSAPLSKVDLDTSPAILIPHYDEDSSTLFVTGRGDSIVRTFEISCEHPHIFALSDFKGDGLHQGLSFLPKSVVDVRNVEFARALRLTSTNIEPISFRVPRLRTNYFQDDLFPDSKVAWEPVVKASDWFSGIDGTPKRVSLKPTDMQSLSEAAPEQPKQRKFESFQEYSAKYKTDDQRKEELLSAMSSKLQVNDKPLPQDLTEGVDPDEWDD